MRDTTGVCGTTGACGTTGTCATTGTGDTSTSSRRAVLGTAVAVLGGLAGCTGDGGGDDADGDATDTTDPADLDLREANVVGVRIDGDGEEVTFDVTLHHDDDGEEGYANWWQVETLAGDRVGRRDLAHPHSQQPFTRSGTFAVESDCVVVRGHDQTHGYGGQAMLVDLETGAVRRVGQGSDSEQFDSSDCP